MSQPRPRILPFDLVFEPASRTVFPAIRSALAESRQDPRDRDAFLMLRDVVSLLRELRPEQGLGEAIDQLAALVHHGYLFWSAGRVTLELPAERLPDLLGQMRSLDDPASEQPSLYIQVPERRIWAQVIPGQAHEPLDGFFLHPAPEPGVCRVLGVFGMHPERMGFSVAEVVGSHPAVSTRPDGTLLFSPALPGAAAAGLYSMVDEGELLELGWRVLELGVGSWELGATAPGSSFAAPTS